MQSSALFEASLTENALKFLFFNSATGLGRVLDYRFRSTYADNARLKNAVFPSFFRATDQDNEIWLLLRGHMTHHPTKKRPRFLFLIQYVLVRLVAIFTTELFRTVQVFVHYGMAYINGQKTF